MARPPIMTPVKRFWKKRVSLQNGQSIEIEMPCCNACDAEIDDVLTAALLLHVPGSSHIENIPWSGPYALCTNCRPLYGITAERFFLVPVPEGVSVRDALKDQLVNFTSALEALAAEAE